MARRHQQRERRSHPDLRGYLELQIQETDNSLHDAQSQSVSVAYGIRRTPNLKEFLVDVGQLVSGYADTGIADLDADEILLQEAAEPDPSLAGVFDRVRNQVS